jgi:predicted metal-dependent hydrolase
VGKGRVRISANSKEVNEEERELPRAFPDHESHYAYVWGKRYLLKVIEKDATPAVKSENSRMVLRIPVGSSEKKKQAVIDEWYCVQLKEAVPPLIAKWQPLVGMTLQRVFVKKMKTRWGSCSRTSASIQLNTDLAPKPRECLEYILVHEMAHLVETTHNARFFALMDSLLPEWRHQRDVLNRLPVRRESRDRVRNASGSAASQ